MKFQRGLYPFFAQVTPPKLHPAPLYQPLTMCQIGPFPTLHYTQSPHTTHVHTATHHLLSLMEPNEPNEPNAPPKRLPIQQQQRQQQRSAPCCPSRSRVPYEMAHKAPCVRGRGLRPFGFFFLGGGSCIGFLAFLQKWKFYGGASEKDSDALFLALILRARAFSSGCYFC